MISPQLEFHRRGVGLVPALGERDGGVALHVERDRGALLRTCTCQGGKTKRVCGHLRTLGRLLREAAPDLAGRAFEDVFAASPWQRLARLLHDGEAHPVVGIRVEAVADPPAFRFVAPDGRTLALTRDASPAARRLAERCGAEPRHRARLLTRLRTLQVTPEEERINDAGLKTQRQAFEESFWRLLGYHCWREGLDTPPGVAVELRSGEFLLDLGALQVAVPRSRAAALLEFVSERSGSVVQPIPLRSLLCVAESTELDLDLRGPIEALQAQGEARTLARAGPFRYGPLLYLPELELMTELETLGRERKFLAPVRMELRRSRVAGIEVPAIAAGQAEARVARGPAVLREYDYLEVTPEMLERSWYWLSLRYGFGSSSLTLGEMLGALRRRERYLETPAGYVDLEAPAFAVLATLRARREDDLTDGGRVRLSPGELLRLQAATARPLYVQEGRAGSPVLTRLLALQPSEPLPAPPSLCSELRPYQKVGLDWLRFLFENGLSGLLCDDMGLGKTHQAMALFLALHEQLEIPEPFLVVCPTTVVSHWRDKLRAFAPTLRACVYHGSQRKLEPLGPGSVLITSYGLLRNDLARLQETSFAVAVFDEVQQVKNAGTQAYQAAAALEARMKLGLTGTPIENQLSDLKALFDLVLPGHLGGDEHFARRYPTSDARRLDDLRRLISPFVLRRLKTAVLEELPAKIEDVRLCALSDEQVKLYRDAVAGKGEALAAQLRSAQQAIPYIHVFALLNLLKRICAHPALAAGRPEAYTEYASGKWDLFAEVLQECLESGQKVVVFTQFLGMIAIMQQHLRAAGVAFVTLTGQSTERGRIVDRFNQDEDCRVFLGSLKAGGSGIDLVGGSVVIHYDRWWNAAREDQATDRVHRIGQRRAVQVFKLVTEGTLEEKIAAIIERKRALAGSVLQADDPHLAKVFTREEILDLLRPV